MSRFQDLAESLRELDQKWKPLDWQIPVGRALFYQGVKDIGAQCGRSAGKTEFCGYSTWRWALEHPGSENYIFEPLQKQAKEILWAPQRIQSFGPQEWIQSINNTEMRITFKNGSFIKIDGSDNVEALRGIKPKGIVVYDELKDHKKGFLDAMEPNRARYDAPALYLGTPPMLHNHYIDIMQRLKSSADAFYTRATSFDNPYNSKSFLEKKKRELIAAGEIETWLREYEALFVKGGKRSLFPRILSMRFPRFENVLQRIKDINKWTIVVGFDPASTSVFGVVFLLFNPYSKQIIAFDELYIDNPLLMTASKVHEAVKEKLSPLIGRVRDVEFCYDEAAAWFKNEISEIESRWWLAPSNKSEFGVDGYIGLVRAVMNKGLITICAECPKLIWEMESYIKDEKGKIPKKNDHNINALQYSLGHLGLDYAELLERKPIPREERRGFRLEEDFPGDPMAGLGGESYADYPTDL